MSKVDVEMIERLTECTLATVEYMVFLKNKSKHEFSRQQSIAQEGIDYLRECKHVCKNRCKQIFEKHKGSVSLYVKNMEERI